jgi:hypothetical protein
MHIAPFQSCTPSNCLTTHILVAPPHQGNVQHSYYCSPQAQPTLPLESHAPSIPCVLQEFASAFGQEAYSNIVQRWQAKLQRAAAREQLWAKITAAKPAIFAQTPQT